MSLGLANGERLFLVACLSWRQVRRVMLRCALRRRSFAAATVALTIVLAAVLIVLW